MTDRPSHDIVASARRSAGWHRIVRRRTGRRRRALPRVGARARHSSRCSLRRGDGLQRLRRSEAQTAIWELFVPDLPVGSRYAYVIDAGTPLPDPASRFQPDGVHGWSEVVDPLAYNWTRRGMARRRSPSAW